MGGIFSSPSPPPPPPPADPPTVSDPAVVQAGKDAALALRKRKGAGSTVVTGGEGDTSAAPVATKRLLGE